MTAQTTNLSPASDVWGSQVQQQLAATDLWRPYGQVSAVNGHSLRAKGLRVGLNDWCWVQVPGSTGCAAEVVGFEGDESILMPLTSLRGVSQGCRVSFGEVPAYPQLDQLKGRVIDGLCRPLDNLGEIALDTKPAIKERLNPLRRRPIDQPLDVGVRAINSLLTLGVGQRVGLFAGSGVGKSVLLGMLARNVKADVVVVGLVGERGREVQDFVANNLGSGLENSVVVAAPADEAPALRLRSAQLATDIACHYRREGANVLLLVDSLTRVAQAQREIGLAAGEPATSKGYPPSVFSLLPNLVERAGAVEDYAGSITAIYTVLVEEDDLNDPIVDSIRAILDGHFVLSRQLADSGHYPAIDIQASISRLQQKLQTADQRKLALRFRQMWARHAEQQDLVSLGAYQRGSDALLDDAISKHAGMSAFLQQDEAEVFRSDQGHGQLQDLLAGSG